MQCRCIYMCVCLRVCVFVCVCVCIYIYIYRYILGKSVVAHCNKEIKRRAKRRGKGFQEAQKMLFLENCYLDYCKSSFNQCI